MHNSDRIPNVTQSNLSDENVQILQRKQWDFMTVSCGDQKQLIKACYDYIYSDSKTLSAWSIQTEQLCEDLECCPSDLLRMMDDRNGSREQVMGIHARSAT